MLLLSDYHATFYIAVIILPCFYKIKVSKTKIIIIKLELCCCCLQVVLSSYVKVRLYAVWFLVVCLFSICIISNRSFFRKSLLCASPCCLISFCCRRCYRATIHIHWSSRITTTTPLHIPTNIWLNEVMINGKKEKLDHLHRLMPVDDNFSRNDFFCLKYI